MRHPALALTLALALAATHPRAAAAPPPDDTPATLRPVTSTYTIEVGTAHIADTYLTPMRYTGTHTAIQYTRLQAMRFDPARWTMQLRLGIEADLTKNPAKNINLYNLGIRASWAMMRRYTITPIPALTAGIGPALSLDAGALYIHRSGNNPASARAALTADAATYAQWQGAILGIPLTARYTVLLPITGAYFSPDYGELYYQIYLGYHKGLIHPVWWPSYFALDNLATLNIHLGATTLTLGYHNTIRSTKTTSLITRNITHALTIGITTDWITLRPNAKTLPNATIISAY